MLGQIKDSNGNKFLLTSAFNADSGYKITFTPLQDGAMMCGRAWRQVCSMEDFSIFLETYNSHIDAESSIILNKLQKLLWSNTTEVTITGTDSSDDRTLSISANLGDEGSSVAFNWRFECTLLTNEEYSRELVQPLLTSLVYLSYENSLLTSILKRKDDEISEHRSNGSVLKRAHLETRLFNSEQFQTDIKTSKKAIDIMKNPAEQITELGLSEKYLQINSLREEHTATQNDDHKDTSTAEVSAATSFRSTNTERSSPVKTPTKHKLDTTEQDQTATTEQTDKEREEKRRSEIEKLQSKPRKDKKPRKNNSIF